jgi:hypothetical protein
MVIVLENFAKEFMQKIWAQVIGTNLGCKWRGRFSLQQSNIQP